jgi:hypothetical protein
VKHSDSLGKYDFTRDGVTYRCEADFPSTGEKALWGAKVEGTTYCIREYDPSDVSSLERCASFEDDVVAAVKRRKKGGEEACPEERAI